MNIIKDIDKYIDEIITLDDKFYDQEYLWSNDYQRKVYERNKESFIAVIDNDKLIGYLNYLNIREDKYNEIKSSNIIIDEFALDDIIPFTNNNNIVINSVVIDRNYQNTDVIKYITDGLLDKLKELENNGYRIKSLDLTAISEDGAKFAKNLGLDLYKELEDGNKLFIKEDNIISSIEESLNKLKTSK